MDRQRFTIQIERHQKTVRRFLTALCCGDGALADDLAQDTFVKAYMKCGDLREEGKFLAWIYRIAYNTYIGSRRNPFRFASIETAETERSVEYADSAFEYQDLYRCLNRLSEKERCAILLYYMQGYSINEISVVTDSTADAVKQLLSRGRRHLKELLDNAL